MECDGGIRLLGCAEQAQAPDFLVRCAPHDFFLSRLPLAIYFKVYVCLLDSSDHFALFAQSNLFTHCLTATHLKNNLAFLV